MPLHSTGKSDKKRSKEVVKKKKEHKPFDNCIDRIDELTDQIRHSSPEDEKWICDVKKEISTIIKEMDQK